MREAGECLVFVGHAHAVGEFQWRVFHAVHVYVVWQRTDVVVENAAGFGPCLLQSLHGHGIRPYGSVHLACRGVEVGVGVV